MIPAYGNDDDLMVSHDDGLPPRHRWIARAVLLEYFFILHGRKPFRPDPEDFAVYRSSQRRGCRQEFALAIAVLHAAGHLRWLPGGRFKTVSRSVMTVAEFKREYPDALWHNGVAWPDGEAT